MGTNLRIKIVTQEEVKQCGFKPEPHTVALKDDGCWWALIKDDEIVSVLCVMDKNGGKCYTNVFTPQDQRGKGYSTVLVRFLSNKIYQKEYQIAHCLRASVNVFGRAGFRLKKVRRFKYGDQYYMEKEQK